MDSDAIASFLNATYPDPELIIKSELGNDIATRVRRAFGPAFIISVTPREMGILSPYAQEYFRRTREGELGHPLEDMLSDNKEEEVWERQAMEMETASKLLLKDQNQFILGAQPSYADFFITGSLQSARTVDEEIFERCMKYAGLQKVYNSCVPYMK